MNKKESVTIRMSNKNVEKLRTFSRLNNISQGQFIENLIEQCDDSGNRKLNNMRLEYLLRYENYFLKDKEKQVREPVKYYIEEGERKYALPQWIVIPIKKVQNELTNEFKIEDSLENYIMQYWLAIDYDMKKNRYIIEEIIDIRQQDDIKAKLNISRCKIASNLYDIKKHIEKYAPTTIVAQVENNIVTETNDDTILDKFFN